MKPSKRNFPLVPRLAWGATVVVGVSLCVAVFVASSGCTSTPDDIPAGVLGDDDSEVADSSPDSASMALDAADAGDVVEETIDADLEDASDAGLDGE